MASVRSVAVQVARAVASGVTRIESAAETDLILTVNIASDGDAFNLRGAGTLSYDCTVDWGDGSSDAIVTTSADTESALTHTYATAGTYTIRVSGTFPAIRMGDSTTRTALITVENLGVVGWAASGLRSGFEFCNRMTSFTAGNTDTSAVNDMYRTFRLCDRATSIDLRGMDTSLVTTMESLFHDCNALTTLNLSGFQTGNVVTFSSIFHDCKLLTSIDVSGFDTSSAQGMRSMFAQCESVTSLDLSNFDTSGVFSFANMFDRCGDLTSLDISSFDTSSALDFSLMFSGANSLSAIDVSNFDTSSATNFRRMFRSVSATDIRCDLFDISAATNLSDFLQNSALTTARYDAVLLAWDAQTVNSGLSVNFGSSEFTGGGAAEAARTSLINNDGWTISDGGAA